MWIESKQNGILINLENIADVVIQGAADSYRVKCYTHSGFGMTVFEGDRDDCDRKVKEISKLIHAVGV